MLVFAGGGAVILAYTSVGLLVIGAAALVVFAIESLFKALGRRRTRQAPVDLTPVIPIARARAHRVRRIARKRRGAA